MRRFDLEQYLPFLINRVAGAMLHFASGEFRKAGVTVATFRILAALRRESECRFGALARITCIEPPSLTRHLGALVRRRLVRKRVDPEDSRTVILSLAPAGRARIERLLPSAVAMRNHILDGFSAREARALERGLDRIYSNLQRHSADWIGYR